MPLIFAVIMTVIVLFAFVMHKTRTSKKTNTGKGKMILLSVLMFSCIVVVVSIYVSASWLNMGSFILGLVALLLPLIRFASPHKESHQNWGIFTVASFSACAISLCMQIFYMAHLVQIADWSALVDTAPMVSFSSAALLALTIVLHMVCYRQNKNQPVLE